MKVDESEYSGDEEFVENVERMELDENSDPESDEGGAEVSFVSNGTTLIAQSPSRDSEPNICSRNKCVEGTLKNGALVVFDVNPKTGNKYAKCRKCKAYADELGNPKVRTLFKPNISNEISPPTDSKSRPLVAVGGLLRRILACICFRTYANCLDERRCASWKKVS
jgi:hypothetical protein